MQHFRGRGCYIIKLGCRLQFDTTLKQALALADTIDKNGPDRPTDMQVQHTPPSLWLASCHTTFEACARPLCLPGLGIMAKLRLGTEQTQYAIDQRSVITACHACLSFWVSRRPLAQAL